MIRLLKFLVLAFILGACRPDVGLSSDDRSNALDASSPGVGLFGPSRLEAQSAGVTRAFVLAKLARLYPEQSPEFIRKRIANADDAHMFLRSFVPYYYDFLATQNLAIMKKTEPFVGWIGGDLHIENFGALVSLKREAHLGPNDLDDAGPGSYAADLLRFFVSLKLAGIDVLPTDVLEAHALGLTGQKRKLSLVSRKILDKAKEKMRKGLQAKKKYVKGRCKSKPRFKKLKKPNRSLTLGEMTAIKQALQRGNPNVSLDFYDSYVYERDVGGSGGLSRYEILTRAVVAPGAKNIRCAVWLELKPITERPGSCPATSCATKLPPGERMTKTIDIMFGAAFKDTYRAVLIALPGTARPDGAAFLMRYRFSAQQKYSFDDYDASTKKAVALDQAYLIGRFHRRSIADKFAGNAASRDDFIKRMARAFAEVAPWSAAVNAVSDYMSSSYRAAR